MDVRALRSLIYSFQLDAADEFIRRNSSSDAPAKLITRFRKAIQFNSESSLFAMAQSQQSSVSVAGRWWTLWPKEDRLRIKGTVGAECKRIGVFVNDRLVKLVNTAPAHDDPMHRRLFRFNMNADILLALPRKTVVGVGSEYGCLRHRDGGITYRDPRLSGNSTLFKLLASSHFLTKKGRLLRLMDQNESWKQSALEAYKMFQAYFDARFGYRPFIIYGTLLGLHRESDFIAHDDDMDVAYFSKYTNPQDIKQELKEIVFAMLSDGYDIKLARKPGFFKPYINGIWFDVFPMWFDRDSLWMMNTTRLRARPEAILPLRTANFRGVEVDIPRDPERYVELQYGPNWRTPDPGYRAAGEPGTSEYLAGSCMNTGELKAFYAEVNGLATQQSGAGRLSVADRDTDELA